VKIKCPKCKKVAELSPDFSLVRCEKCGLEISYGEYVKEFDNDPDGLAARLEERFGIRYKPSE